MNHSSIGSALLGKTREAVIGLLFSSPELGLHVREVARRTGFSAPTVARELRLLEVAGVLSVTAVGPQLHYRPDPACPLYEELRSIATKTWGLRGRIGRALEAIEGIDYAFIFGSFAAGSPHAASDVDLAVIGESDFAVLSEALSSVSSDVGRSIHPTLYRPAEWRRKRTEGNSFVVAIAQGPKLFLIGNEEGLNGLGEPGAPRRAKAAKPPSGHAKRGGKPPESRRAVPGRGKTGRNT